MDRILALLIGVPLGILVLKYRKRVKDFFGDIAFAEKYLGVGGSYTFIVIMGILIFVFSLMYALGTLQELLLQIFGRFLPR